MKHSHKKIFMIVLTLLALSLSVLGITPATHVYALGTNLAPSATATASSYFNSPNPQYAPAKVTDGLYAWDVNEWSSASELNPWIQLTWGGSISAETIKLYDRINWYDNANSGTLSFSSGPDIAVTGIPTDGSVKIITFPARTFTWVRFTVTGGTGTNVGLAEFKVFDTTPPAPSILAGTGSLSDVPTFSKLSNLDLNWTVTGMTGATPQYVQIWSREQNLASPNPWGGCQDAAVANTLTYANGTYAYDLSGYGDQDVVEFRVLVENTFCLDLDKETPASTEAAQGVTFIDNYYLEGLQAGVPSIEYNYEDNHVACNTFEMWAIVSDNMYLNPTDSYSGFKAWNTSTTGTFAAPAPEGAANALLSWVYTFPSTASGAWSFDMNPTDIVGNEWGTDYFRDHVDVLPSELEDCENFSDVAGHADEVYIRYLADLGLIAGNLDGSFSPNNTLTRAEAAALIEKANGLEEDDVDFPASAPAGCEFTDVSASDWFSGWVWAACEDGFLNGLGGGLFGPSDLLTRGQIVTIFNNINTMANGEVGSFLEDDLSNPSYETVLNDEWDEWDPYFIRTASWTDVFVGDYYALPAIRAYALGVVEGTSATTFSPNQPVLRGEFARMLYRALSLEI